MSVKARNFHPSGGAKAIGMEALSRLRCDLFAVAFFNHLRALVVLRVVCLWTPIKRAKEWARMKKELKDPLQKLYFFKDSLALERRGLCYALGQSVAT